MKVTNMKNANGNTVSNQFIIYHDDKIFFQSYNSIIAIVDVNGKMTIGKHFDYSVTTSKYLHLFIDSTALYAMDAETRNSYRLIRGESLSYSRIIQKCIDENIFSYDAELV